MLLTDKELVIIEKDIISEHLLNRISSCGAYFGVMEMNIVNRANNGYDWSYGDRALTLKLEKVKVELQSRRTESFDKVTKEKASSKGQSGCKIYANEKMRNFYVELGKRRLVMSS